MATTTSTTTTTAAAAAKAPAISTWVNDNHDVRAPVNYAPTEGKAFDSKALPPPTKYGEVVESSRMMTFYNARGKEDTFKLDVNGFEIHKLPPKERDISTDEKIVEEYYPETEELLKKLTGAAHVFCVGHILRRATNEIIREARDTQRFHRWVTTWPHSDCPVQDDDLMHQAAVMNACALPPGSSRRATAERLVAAGARWMLVQTWRPLRTVRRDPLALCDALSYDHADWRWRVPEVAGLTGNGILAHPGAEERHRWYYMHEMTPEEIFVFKGGDSRMGEPGLTGYTGAHTSVILPDSADAPPRESIEQRLIALWE